MPAAGAAADAADVADQAGGAGRSDAVELEQAAAAVLDQRGQFLLRRLDLLVDLDQLADQLRRQPATGPPDKVTRPDRGQQCAGLVGGQELC
ncbi:hypothetical protein Daura_03990 [Dactylosporangium aurantiacum]|uniref:Uncharacterized protein n=1 Tax=Dactylosporangium aurantiacum TaxID=35754 RepID=A0A9Q9MI69_9ACTN|nr:hypothetical protein [Dactylosporangium aurantiacum]MDG6110246.1 hypothetical protein [Dactylosporangium aurantiacum]UWZ60263.1 hypothetical protein Daura_03990 [Dactylosporangium aurantiacum]